MKLTAKDVAMIRKYGTPIKCETERYVLELKKLDSPVEFENPKDAGGAYGKQKLKGDGNDILLLNGLTPEQIRWLDKYLADFEQKNKKAAEEMNAEEVKAFFDFLKEQQFFDCNSSTQEYKGRSLIQVNGHIYRRNSNECHGVIIPIGTTYEDRKKSQRANVEGALFVTDDRGGARITNVPTDYQPIGKNVKIISYAKALEKQTIDLIKVHVLAKKVKR